MDGGQVALGTSTTNPVFKKKKEFNFAWPQ